LSISICKKLKISNQAANPKFFIIDIKQNSREFDQNQNLTSNKSNLMTPEDSIKLRQSQLIDLKFLYMVNFNRTDSSSEPLDNDKLAEYTNNFDPDKIEVIVYNGKDVGRLRVVRSADEIYIGGIQILPNFQGKGIGTIILQRLIDEAKMTSKNIKLEVQKVNIRAFKLYTKLGFVITSETNEQFIMKKSTDTAE